MRAYLIDPVERVVREVTLAGHTAAQTIAAIGRVLATGRPDCTQITPEHDGLWRVPPLVSTLPEPEGFFAFDLGSWQGMSEVVRGAAIITGIGKDGDDRELHPPAMTLAEVEARVEWLDDVRATMGRPVWVTGEGCT